MLDDDEVPSVVYQRGTAMPAPADVPTLEQRYARQVKAAWDAVTAVVTWPGGGTDAYRAWIGTCGRIATALIMSDREGES